MALPRTPTHDVHGDGGEVGYREDEVEDVWDDTELINAYERAMSSFHEATGPASGKRRSRGGHGKKKETTKAAKDSDSDKGRDRASKAKPARPASSSSSFSSRQGHSHRVWRVGDKCQAVWTEDSQVYRATIDSINKKNNSCIVTFIDYGNSEKQQLGDLLPAEEPAHANESLDNDTDSDRSYAYDNRSEDNREFMNGGGWSRHRDESTGQEPHGHHYGDTDGGGQYSYGHREGPSGHRPPHMASSMGQRTDPSLGPEGPAAAPSMPVGDVDESLARMLMSWYQTGFQTGYFMAQQEMRQQLQEQGDMQSPSYQAYPTHPPRPSYPPQHSYPPPQASYQRHPPPQYQDPRMARSPYAAARMW